jgi:hypothetical protein
MPDVHQIEKKSCDDDDVKIEYKISHKYDITSNVDNQYG